MPKIITLPKDKLVATAVLDLSIDSASSTASIASSATGQTDKKIPKKSPQRTIAETLAELRARKNELEELDYLIINVKNLDSEGIKKHQILTKQYKIKKAKYNRFKLYKEKVMLYLLETVESYYYRYITKLSRMSLASLTEVIIMLKDRFILTLKETRRQLLQ